MGSPVIETNLDISAKRAALLDQCPTSLRGDFLVSRSLENAQGCIRAIAAFEPPPFYESPAAAPQQMLSRSTVSAVESAFNTLANTVLSNNARTLEDLVREMLRPMLKSWLDDNLPGLVERIVKAEIERVSRGR